MEANDVIFRHWYFRYDWRPSYICNGSLCTYKKIVFILKSAMES